MRRKILIGIVALPILLFLGAAVYLAFADLGQYRGTVEQAVTEALGRKLTIAGDFQPHVSLALRVVAEDITLAGAAWSTGPPMAHIDRFEVTVNLWSLLSGPIRVRDLRIHGARVRLEVDADGRANWEFDRGDETSAAGNGVGAGGPPVVIEHLELTDVELVYADPSGERELRVDRLDFDPAEGDLREVGLTGSLNGTAMELAGRVSPLYRWIEGGSVEENLHGRFGDVELTLLRGSLEDLGSLRGLNVKIEVNGPDISTVTETLALPSLGSGPFRLAGRVAPAAHGSDLALDATLGELTARARGRVSDLLDPADLEVTLTASGPDLAAVGSLLCFDGLPPGAFDVSGTLSREGSRWAVEELTAHLGEDTLSANGVLGAPPRMLDTDFTFQVAIADLSAFATVAGADLPSVPIRASGRLVRKEGGLAMEEVEAHVGEAHVRVEGMVGDPPELAGTDLRIRGSGPDLSAFESFAGVALPALPFEIAGRAMHRGSGIALEDVRASLGEHQLSVAGTLVTAPRLLGTALRVEASGPSLAEVATLVDMANLPDLPADPYDVRGRVVVKDGGYELDALKASLGEIVLEVDGRVGPLPDLAGTDVRVHLSGPDLSDLAGLVGLPEVPAEPYQVGGRVRIVETGYELEALQAKVGTVTLSLDGAVGALPELDGTDLEVVARGPDLSALTAYPEVPALPTGPFAVSGNVRVDGGTYCVDDVTAEFDANRIEVSGTIVPGNGLAGTDVTVEASGPDLADIARFASEAGLGELPDLPRRNDESYDASGRVRFLEAGYELRNVRVRLGDATVWVDGTVGPPPELRGTDLTVKAKGANSSEIGILAGVELPAEPFQVRGRVERWDDGTRFHEVLVEFGDYHAKVDGTLGELPKLAGTRLDVEARGPSLSLIGQLLERSDLPDGSFEVSGHFEGTREQFALQDFHARLGDSDLAGSFRLDLRDKPDLRGEFSSEHLNLRALLPRESPDRPPEDAAASEEENAPGTDPDLLIPDQPLELEWLDKWDVDVCFKAAELITPKMTLSDVDIGLRLKDGRLHLDPAEATSLLEGHVVASITLEPVTEGHRLIAHVKGDGLRPDLGLADDPGGRPPLGFRLEFEGIGATPHAIVSGANGRLLITQGEGRVSNAALDLLGADVLMEVFGALNPFVKEEPYTRFECSVVFVDLQDGTATLQPIALRTDKMTVVGYGKIDFGTERLDLVWTAKPRKGIGVSASAITNPYVKLGGTLGTPSIEVKPLDAVIATGAGVATLGLSFLAKGMWDRVTADKKVCKKALEEVERRTAQKTP